MKNLKKLWGTLISLVIFGAVSFIGINLVNEEQPVTTDHSESSFSIEQQTNTSTQRNNDLPQEEDLAPTVNNDLPQEEDLAPTGNNPGPQDLGRSSFTRNDTRSEDGWIDYHDLDQLGRPTGADALINKSMINTGTSANRNIRPPGFISGPRYDHSRGHLIAKQFGGSGDDERNLVTLFQFPVNDPYMNYYELKIRRALNHGESVRYRVTPQYAGNESIPESVKLEAKGSDENTAIDFVILIPNVK